jgi:hypothetical protein
MTVAADRKARRRTWPPISKERVRRIHIMAPRLENLMRGTIGYCDEHAASGSHDAAVAAYQAAAKGGRRPY